MCLQMFKQKFPANKCFFTSDLHFCHKNIIAHCKRPFSSLEEMHQYYIEYWNQTISKNDYIFILGDLVFSHSKNAWRTIISKLNGQKILIIGNHDDLKSICYDDFLYTTKHDSFQFDDNGKIKEIFMSHYPCLSWPNQHRGSWHLFGHCHGTMNKNKLAKEQMDVGIDISGHIFTYFDIKSIINGNV